MNNSARVKPQSVDANRSAVPPPCETKAYECLHRANAIARALGVLVLNDMINSARSADHGMLMHCLESIEEYT
ncbi:hypothetical protein ABTN24_20105, partial [Acinetobacter baumannii]